MRRWKAFALLAALAALLLGLLAPAFGSAAKVNLMAINERVLDTTAENMPRTVGDVLYVPYTMLSYNATGISLGVTAMYSNTRRTVLVTDGQKAVTFDTQANTAEDVDGNPLPIRAMVRNSTVFVPIDWLCEYFGSIACTRTHTPYGTLIRVTSSAARLNDQDFVGAANNQLAAALQRYLDSGGQGEGADPMPTSGVEATETPSGAELYLALRWGPEAAGCAHALEARGRRALFLLSPEELAQEDDLVRALAGAGHTLGLTLAGEDPKDCLAQADRGRELAAAAARYNVLVVNAPGLDADGRQALAEAGYVVWKPTTNREFTSAAALIRSLDARKVNFVELACANGSEALLRSALNAMEQENCRIYQATAPALAK